MTDMCHAQITFGDAGTDAVSQSYSNTLRAENVLAVLGSDAGFIVSIPTTLHSLCKGSGAPTCAPHDIHTRAAKCSVI